MSDTPTGTPTTPPVITTTATDEKQTLYDLVRTLIESTGLLGLVAEKMSNEPEKTARASKWVSDNLAKIITGIETPLLKELEPLVQALVKIVVTLFDPMAAALGEAAQTYVETVAKGLDIGQPDGINRTGNQATASAGAFFDNIMKPLVNVISKNPPNKAGSGLENLNATLGSLVAIHMMTWIVDIVGDVSGIGALKFFRSFNRGMLRALDIRSLAQVAMGVYQEIFMAVPARYDLYEQWPIKYPSETEDMKLWIRGAKTGKEVQSILAKLGYAPELQTQFLTTTQQYLDDSALGTLGNSGFMKQEDIRATLKLKGWTDDKVDQQMFWLNHNRVFAIVQTVQQRLEAMFISGKITETDYRSVLHNLFFSDLEIEWLIGAGQIQKTSDSKAKKLSRSDLAKAYELGVYTEDQVLSYLVDSGYSVDDANVIMQIEIYSKAQLAEKQQLIAARLRVTAQQESAAAAAEIQKNADAEAAARLALANLENQFAASLAG